ncbi:low molecular weight protein-tyrosine-phosphatase [Massilia sp. TS11]|uniref:low molecular weight protein-tyrosine-phosphatase n=1 Tax=Massilia sp. TS11 TaxID=2908003 RepID=UPI001EDA3A8F|nr:low molecular weight protein-tyrosine-phosphatase [Massilia sp. TS11]MCG2584804.1 low molecular weight phosphotyrosine protein phosphatase [Massilia sp. TS11]
MASISILFVCMGNICRSPTAEGVFRAQAEAAGLGAQLHIDSAATHAYHTGEPPDARSIAHAARRGVDLSLLRARPVQPSDFSRFDLVLAMDHGNLDRLLAQCPDVHRHKLGLFMDYAEQHTSAIVPDPYYGGPEDFETVLDYVEAASSGLLAQLRKRLG